ncbi:unnamed protein product [Effrenium voratum]|nr:unnamed protein product [Effrenium voratum]
MASGQRRRHGRRAWLLTACTLTAITSPSLEFLHAQQAAHRFSQPVLQRHRSAVALSAAYSPAGPGEEWTPEQEQAVMEEVLGRVPASSKETSSLAAEPLPKHGAC